MLGRSHRSEPARAKLREAIHLTREILEIPLSHRIAIVPGSDTGAIELALWSLLGPRGVQVLAWEWFGHEWVTDIVTQLKLPNARAIVAPYGELPDLMSLDFDCDVVFAWNGTTSGVRVPSADFIPADRRGLTICDATSAAFAQRLDWSKLDVATFSWQKALGGEAGHGMLVLGPRAVDRLQVYAPDRALPKLFRLTDGGKLIEDLFDGATINTPSMLCVEDYLDALHWAKSVGGLSGLTVRADANAGVLADWVTRTAWIDFMARDPKTRSNTSVCLRIVDPTATAGDGGRAFAHAMAQLLEDEGVAYDIEAYRRAPPGLRIWCGCTVDVDDITALTPWLDWAHNRLISTWSVEPAPLELTSRK